MIGEGIVLLGIQNLKKSRCGISVIGGGKFIHLIEYHNRIGNAGLLYAVHHSSRHSTKVSSPVPADVRLVSYTAKAHANIFSSESLSNTLSDTGFTGTGCTHKEENRPGLLLLQIHDRNLLNHSLLNLL